LFNAGFVDPGYTRVAPSNVTLAMITIPSPAGTCRTIRVKAKQAAGPFTTPWAVRGKRFPHGVNISSPGQGVNPGELLRGAFPGESGRSRIVGEKGRDS
jgi:hypothetical protein